MNIKILVCCHNDAVPTIKNIKSNILTPIHCGRASASKQSKSLLEYMIGDDTGDNISHKNPTYCELTALYWAWKNLSSLGNPDYIGLFHYRRFLNFGNCQLEQQFGSCDNFSEENMIKFGWNDECLIREIEKYDLIIPNKFVFHKGENLLSIYDQYAESHNKEDLDLALKLVLDRHSGFNESVNLFYKENGLFLWNMFIAKQSIFIELCQFIFDILFELEKQIDISKYDEYQKRVFGFLSERLLHIFVMKLKMNN